MPDIGLPVPIDPHPLPPAVLEAIAVPLTFFFGFFSVAFLCIPCWSVVSWAFEGLLVQENLLITFQNALHCLMASFVKFSCTGSALHAIRHLMQSALTMDFFACRS